MRNPVEWAQILTLANSTTQRSTVLQLFIFNENLYISSTKGKDKIKICTVHGKIEEQDFLFYYYVFFKLIEAKLKVIQPCLSLLKYSVLILPASSVG